MRLTIQDVAAKSLSRIPSKAALLIVSKMEAVAAAPLARNVNAKPLVGRPGEFRLRVGDWRAIYTIDSAAQEVILMDVRKRGEAYR